MLYHIGAIMRLNELGLLRSLRRISSVSGGSITAAYLALHWRKLEWNEASQVSSPCAMFSKKLKIGEGNKPQAARG
jgi:NTE family protein